ncbi:alpha/beta hydrolase fold domain-containing protein [Cellulosilyticum sp. ST5]|nr:alpha/beta hydrolase fold domain-containing protein [Cellulosilyticum sp. WCF-2]QEH67834.1 alpha/beta hydrolase [Cellulosilyticum sp. WCF-2]
MVGDSAGGNLATVLCLMASDKVYSSFVLRYLSIHGLIEIWNVAV